MTYYTNCCVKTCSNIFRPDSDIRFFEFPFGNQQLLDNWINAVSFDEFFMISQNTLICSEHFVDDDYVLENGSYELSQTAIPSKFEDKNESMESSNVMGPTIAFNDSNNLQNWSSPPFINNVDKQVNNRGEGCHTSHTISRKSNKKINGCVKTANSSYHTSRTNIDKISNNIDELTSCNYPSNEFIEDVFVVEKNQDNKVENYPMINSPSVYILNSRNIKNNKTVVSNNSKAKVRPTWTLNQKMPLKHKIPNSFTKKLKLLGQKNRRLCSKVRDLASRKQDLIDLQIKYIQLKLAVLETEEKLLQNGIDTSKYSAFSVIHEDKELPTPENIEYDVLLECKFEELKNPKAHTNSSSMTITPECSTQVQSSAASESVIIL